ncbi:hypothetical protein [Limisphaera sp. 4302-co]|uniref:hypothetical protein n=1 Tax=Limisphaera sp. 4302-co TaxID=3400417 RepID=UPI003C21E42C
MKTSDGSRLCWGNVLFPFWARVLQVAVAVFGAGEAGAAVSLSVSPSSAPATYAGMVELTAQGLQPGETVAIRRGLDLNGDGMLGGDEPVTLVVTVTDDAVPLVAGVTNWNVPFDQDPAAGSLKVRLNYYQTWLDHAVGTNVWELSSPTGRFSAVRATQALTLPSLNQGVQGVVRGGGTNQPHAMVVALDVMADQSLAAVAVADRQGRYELRLPHGLYAVIAAKPGWVTDVESAFLVGLDAGQMVTADLDLLPPSRTLRGRLVRADLPDEGLPAVFLDAESDNGLFAPGWTDVDGNFELAVRGGTWYVEPAFEDLALHGCLYASAEQGYLTSTGSVTGVRLEAVAANAAFYGRVLDAGGQPLAGIRLNAHGQTGSRFYDGHDPVTDDQGRYTAMAVGGTPSWWLLRADPLLNRGLTNHVVSGFRFNQAFAPGQAVAQDLRVLQATNQITGTVRDVEGLGVMGIGVFGWCRLGGETYYGSGGWTDPAGRYRMPVAGDAWQMQLACDELQDGGYNCVPVQSVTVSAGGAVVDFVVFPQPAPGMSQPRRLGPNQFQFQVHGLPFTTYEVQVSSDLRQWQTLTTVTPAMEGPVYTNALVTDFVAGGPQRFYRLLRR